MRKLFILVILITFMSMIMSAEFLTEEVRELGTGFCGSSLCKCSENPTDPNGFNPYCGNTQCNRCRPCTVFQQSSCLPPD